MLDEVPLFFLKSLHARLERFAVDVLVSLFNDGLRINVATFVPHRFQ